MPSNPALVGLTQLISRVRAGALGAEDELYRLAQSELRELARRHLRMLPKPGDLDVTGLVNEAWLKIEQRGQGAFENQKHFFAIAGRAIHDAAVEEARRCLSLRRGAALRRIDLDEGIPEPTQAPREFLELEAALAKLAALDASAGELIEQWIFLGMSHEEIARARAVSLSSVRREWRYARAYLAQQLEASGAGPGKI